MAAATQRTAQNKEFTMVYLVQDCEIAHGMTEANYIFVEVWSCGMARPGAVGDFLGSAGAVCDESTFHSAMSQLHGAIDISRYIVS